MSNYDKYIKYKTKFLNFKNKQIGGTNENLVKTITTAYNVERVIENFAKKSDTILNSSTPTQQKIEIDKKLLKKALDEAKSAINIAEGEKTKIDEKIKKAATPTVVPEDTKISTLYCNAIEKLNRAILVLEFLHENFDNVLAVSSVAPAGQPLAENSPVAPAVNSTVQLPTENSTGQSPALNSIKAKAPEQALTKALTTPTKPVARENTRRHSLGGKNVTKTTP